LTLCKARLPVPCWCGIFHTDRGLYLIEPHGPSPYHLSEIRVIDKRMTFAWTAHIELIAQVLKHVTGRKEFPRNHDSRYTSPYTSILSALASHRSFRFSTATRVIDGLLLRVTKPLVVRDLLVPEPRVYPVRHTGSWLRICFCSCGGGLV
jgi:hypothetical protein